MKNTKIIIIIIGVIILLLMPFIINIINVNIPRMYKKENAEIVITEYLPTIIPETAKEESKLLEKTYSKNQKIEILIFENGKVVKKEYETSNLMRIPNFFEKTETAKSITKINKENIEKLKKEIVEKGKIYNGNSGYSTIEIKGSQTIYLYDEDTKAILESYDINF